MQNSSNQTTVLIIRNAYSYDFGGGERFPVSLATQLKKHRYHPIIVSRSPKLRKLAQEHKITEVKGWWWHQQNFSGFRIILLPAYLVWQVILFGWYISLILKYRPAVVHPQSRDDFIAATFAAKLLGKRVVWTDHADLKYIWQNHTTWYKNHVGKMVYLASKLANHITLVSNSEKKLIEKQLQRPLPRKYTVIHNGVEDQLSTIKPTTHDKNTIVFAASSRLVTSKGIGELIEAFKKLGAKTPSELWLLGEGPEEKAFREQAASSSTIKFLGYPKNALDHVAGADVFIHPSYHEGFSISLVEAAMLGKPIIACNVGGNGEIVVNNVNGLLVKSRSSAALYDAMLTLCSNPELRKTMGNESRKTYTDQFVFSEIVEERFVPLYEN